MAPVQPLCCEQGMPPSKRTGISPAKVVRHSPLIPGISDHIAILCLARVPCISTLWSVCSSWRRLLSLSFFHSLRSSNSLPPYLWLYALVRSPSDVFSWFAFNPLSNSWLPLPKLPFPPEFQISSPNFIGVTHSIQCASFGTKLIMVAGSRLCKDERAFGRPQLVPALQCPLIFDTKTREWTEGAPFRVPRKWCVCGTACGKLYVASGCSNNWEVGLSKAVEMYDPEKEMWISLEDLKSSKFSGEAISAVNYGGNLLMVSGKGVMCKAGAIFNPITNKWTNMPRGMMTGCNGSCVVVDERLIVLEETIGKLKEYDPVQDCWFTLGEDEMLKNIELLTGARGKICGVIRRDSGSDLKDVIRIVDIRTKPIVTDLQPPSGQIVALQVLSGMTWSDESG